MHLLLLGCYTRETLLIWMLCHNIFHVKSIVFNKGSYAITDAHHLHAEVLWTSRRLLMTRKKKKMKIIGNFLMMLSPTDSWYLSSFLFFFFFLIKIFFLPLGFIFLLERLTVNAIMCFWFVNTYCPSLLH